MGSGLPEQTSYLLLIFRMAFIVALPIAVLCNFYSMCNHIIQQNDWLYNTSRDSKDNEIL